MKSLITLSLMLGSLLLYGCAGTLNPHPRSPASCHDDTTNSEDHSANHCNGDTTNSQSERGSNPRL
jgi:hypothetical protein